ncbi:MAG TPA: hypothetical protein VM143_03060 [Acidimicrobiales bacterium]|nr:hypothetical protein [Acidimicrobiales bacterium]
MSRKVTGLAATLALALAPAPSPAHAQSSENGWQTSYPVAAESDLQVVLTFAKDDAGRIVYWTTDGACSGGMPWVTNVTPTTTCEQPASAPEDYGSVRGEIIFTGPGSRSITIPIVDDDRAEPANEYFLVRASEGDDVAEQTVWYVAKVRVVDDDGAADTEAPPTSSRATGSRASVADAAGGSRASAAPGADSARTSARSPTDVFTPSAVTAATSPSARISAPPGGPEPGPGLNPAKEVKPIRTTESKGPLSGSRSSLTLLAVVVAVTVGGFAVRRWRRGFMWRSRS